MPNATILCPRTGDTVNLSVKIAVAYANFTAATDLKCKIHNAPDHPECVNGAGQHEGNATTTASPPEQSVVVFTDAHGELDRQDQVKVTAGDTPTPIEEPEVDELIKGNKKLKKVRGRVPNGSTATKVVCKVNKVDASTGTITEVGSGEGTVAANKKWDVTFDPAIELDPAPHIQYFVRVCAFQNTTQLGCESRPVKK